MFKHLFHGAYGLGRGAISVKTASDIAATLTTGLMSPITSQIDPLSVGETARLLRIVQEYGWRLSPMDDKQAILEAIAKLSSDYPSHEFIIDRDEARRILPNVRAPRGDEVELDRLLRFIARVPPDPNTNAGAYVNYLNAPTSATPSPTAAPPSAASVPPPPATPPAAPSASTDGPLHHATEPNGHHQGE